MGNRLSLTDDEALALIDSAREVRIAAVVDGRPLLRTMHAVRIGNALALHGAPRSEKAGWVGAPAVAAVEQVVARIPSWMRHPERACPATTLYRSVQVTGRIEALDDPTERAVALQALMESLQPEGRYRPLDADDPLYKAPIRGLGMWVLRIEAVSGVAKVGAHLPDSEARSVLAGLWSRGEPGDLAGVETISAATGLPWRDVPEGLRARCHATPTDAAAAAALVEDAYWNGDFGADALAEAVLSSAWVGLEADGELVATARASTDRSKRSWIYDVAVRADWRGQGVGSGLMEMLLDHPHVRRTQASLATRDAMAFYERFGFRVRLTDATGPFPRTLMQRL